MNTSGAVLIYATAPDTATAEAIARRLVEDRLAACANILPGMRSVYRWEGTVETADEVVLILKTVHDCAEAAMRRLGELHPYRTPCALVLPLSGGLPAYLAWLAEGVTAPPVGPGAPSPAGSRA